MIKREVIYAALWTLGSGAASFATANRRLRHWADVVPIEQPALFMSEKGGYAAVKALGAPLVWTLYADFYIYVHSSDPYAAPAMTLNPLLDAIEQALAPSAGSGIQNLGLPSMVQHVYIKGKSRPTRGSSATKRSPSYRSKSFACEDRALLGDRQTGEQHEGYRADNRGYRQFN